MNKIIIILGIVILVFVGFLLLKENPSITKLGSVGSECRFYSEVTNSSSTVNSTSKNIVVNNSSGRQYLEIINDGANGVYLNLTTATATARTGILLNANGGSFYMGCDTPIYTGMVTAITSSGTSTLTIVEKN